MKKKEVLSLSREEEVMDGTQGVQVKEGSNSDGGGKNLTVSG